MDAIVAGFQFQHDPEVLPFAVLPTPKVVLVTINSGGVVLSHSASAFCGSIQEKGSVPLASEAAGWRWCAPMQAR